MFFDNRYGNNNADCLWILIIVVILICCCGNDNNNNNCGCIPNNCC